LVGPYTFNFQEITDLLIGAGAVQRISDAASLSKKLAQLIRHKDERHRRGEAGRLRIAAERGALARTLELIERCLPTEKNAT
jgi:3-deoxy-D-manno-octulosonic-acid transferase